MNYYNNKKFYTSAIKLYGTSAKGVNWHSKHTQTIRFKTITNMLPKNMYDVTLADAGCGFGDFYHFLEKLDMLPENYIGIDFIDEMCSIAMQKTGQEILLANICKDCLPTQDYYICSGALNTLNKFDSFLFIQNCYLTSKKGFIFNVLYGDKQSQTYNYMTKEQITQIAQELHVDEVIYETGYLDDDITVAFLKKNR